MGYRIDSYLLTVYSIRSIIFHDKNVYTGGRIYNSSTSNYRIIMYSSGAQNVVGKGANE